MRIARLLPPKPGGFYERAIKKLAKNYPHVETDTQAALAQFIGPNPIPVPCPPKASQLVGVGREVLKIRIASSDQNKGKSGGFRLLLANSGSDAWRPVVVYAKAHTEDMSRQRVLELLEEELADEQPPTGDPQEAHVEESASTAPASAPKPETLPGHLSTPHRDASDLRGGRFGLVRRGACGGGSTRSGD